MLKKYGHILVADYVATDIQEWDSLGAQYLRVELPTSAENEIQMQQKGFYFLAHFFNKRAKRNIIGRKRI